MRLRAPLALLLALVAGAAVAPAASAATAPTPAPRTGPLETILQDDAQLLHRPEAEVRSTLARLRGLGVDRLRVSANWSVVTRDADSETRPANFDASDPAAYEQARWGDLDRLVRLASQAGLKVMVDVAFFAPRWASTDAPGERGRSDVVPAEFGAFATAVARRYSGSFRVPPDVAPVAPNHDESLFDAFFGGGGEPDGPPAPPPVDPLPRVDVLTLWNEPNHTGFLRPQWVRDPNGAYRARSPELYSAMVRAAYPAIKAAVPQTTVLVGATSGSGAYRNKGTGGVPPLRFIRELACVDAKLRPLTTPACANFKAFPGDGWSHHPYSMKATPDTRSGPNQVDDVPIAELPRLAALLDRLVAAGRLSPGLRDIWVTEYGYETNPPSTLSAFGVGDQARFLAWGEFLAWRVPQVKTFAQFLLRDLPPGAERVGTSVKRPYGEWYSGLEFSDGRPKLATESFRAGLFAQRLAKGRLRLWGRLRLGGGPHAVVVEAQPASGAPWSALRTTRLDGKGGTTGLSLDGNGVLDRFARAPRGPAVRYRLRYADAGAQRTTPSIQAVAAVKPAPTVQTKKKQKPAKSRTQR
jgi:hypothetical protein